MFTETINNIPLSFQTTKTVFSPTCADKGTLAMLSVIDLSPTDKLLDLGCGYGIVGIYAAKLIGEQNIVMSDSNKKCIELSKQNAEINGVDNVKIVQSDGFKNLDDKDFTLILSNPPYHADFSVPKHFIEKGFNRLIIGGRMLFVVKRLEWYKRKFIAIFGGLKVHQEEAGYFVLEAVKKTRHYGK